MPEKTAAATRNLWFHTGDAGRIDQDGWFFFVDRIDDYLRRRGENISSFDVETAIQAHPGITQCAVVGVPSERPGGEQEIMAVVLAATSEQAPVDADEVWRWASEHLPRFMVPRYVRFVDKLPLSAANRVQKHKLREAGTADAFDREQQ